MVEFYVDPAFLTSWKPFSSLMMFQNRRFEKLFCKTPCIFLFVYLLSELKKFKERKDRNSIFWWICPIMSVSCFCSYNHFMKAAIWSSYSADNKLTRWVTPPKNTLKHQIRWQTFYRVKGQVFIHFPIHHQLAVVESWSELWETL